MVDSLPLITSMPSASPCSAGTGLRRFLKECRHGLPGVRVDQGAKSLKERPANRRI